MTQTKLPNSLMETPPVSATAPSFTDSATITSTDPGAGVAPVLTLDRNSATPSPSDLIGYLKFDGRDSGGAVQNYASILAQILDATPGSEDGALFVSTYVGGVDTVTMTLLGGRIGIGNSNPQAKLHVGGGADAAVVVNSASPSLYVSEADVTNMQIRNSANDTMLTLGAKTDGTFSDTQGADGAKHFITVNSQNAGFWYDNVSPGSGAGLIIGAANYVFNNPQTVGVQIHSNPYVNSGATPTGSVAITIGNYSGPCIAMNRSTGDGDQLAFYSAGTLVGTVSCSGGVVSYNAFSGSHWSQLKSQKKANILRGTIVETIDEMCSWEGEDPDFEEHLPKFKVSSTAGSKAVYGVFTDWMHKGKAQAWGGTEEYLEQDALITSLGACMVRIDAGVEVAIGDLIESAGNGCGRVQADDVFRSSTVAKVTATIKIDTYEDGSYLVPCTLHCG